MKIKNYTQSELKQAITESNSIRQVLIKLNIVPAGGNYATINKFIKTNNINTSHFHGQVWSKGRILPPRTPTEKYLHNEIPILSYALKKRLISEKYFSESCSHCLLDSWLGAKIPLELDHINGDSSNNNLSNLRLLCPNCHSLTPTYRGKNKKNKSKA